MITAKTNIYRSNGEWCHGTWIDGEFDCSDQLDIDDLSSEEEAIAAAKAMLAGRVDRHDVTRVDDI